MLPAIFHKGVQSITIFSGGGAKPENDPSLLEQALKNQVGTARIRQGVTAKEVSASLMLKISKTLTVPVAYNVSTEFYRALQHLPSFCE